MDAGVIRSDHDAIIGVEQHVAVEPVRPGLHQEEDAEQHRGVADDIGRRRASLWLELDLAVNQINYSGKQRAQEQHEQQPVHDLDERGEQK